VKADSTRWIQVTPSSFAWERAALDWVRARLPDADPWRAWANFELVDDHGVAEVDLLVLSPAGLWVIEIKSRPGTLTGDSHTWRWRRPNGTIFADDNPLIACDRKAKRLKSLVSRSRAVREQLPFFTPLVFLHTETGGSDPATGGLDIRLSPSGRTGVVAADGPDQPGSQQMPEPRPDGVAGILQVLAGADPAFRRSRRPIDATVTNQLLRGLSDAGVRATNRSLRVGSYELTGKLIDDGPGWQDFEARHLYVEAVRRRARIWSVQAARSEDERQTRRRAAEREFTALQGIRHPNIVEVVDYVPEAERGPTVIFEQPASARRLDLWLAEQGDTLDAATRLRLLRESADALRYAHQRRLHHRALTPRCVLVTHEAGRPATVKLRNWQIAERHGSSRGTALGPVVTGTVHAEQLLDDTSGGYLAPEGWSNPDADGVTLDVFSLGSIGYLLLTGRAPATSPGELAARLRQDLGLLVSAALDGVSDALESLIRTATNPDVGARYQSVEDFLEALAEAEAALSQPSEIDTVNPLDAVPDDRLEGGWIVVRDLGRGSTARALLVERDGAHAVFKVALNVEHEERLAEEYEALRRLVSPSIVRARDLIRVGGHQTVVLDVAGQRTLAATLRDDGPVGLDLLERYGTDLLEAVRELETAGIAHRDIKPDNLGVAPRGANDELHLVLFDFSLTKAPLGAVRAGTPPYREPFLAARKQWDLAAERYAAAVTLHEMAAGRVPTFGDGRSDPAVIDDEATVDVGRFDPAVADDLGSFFAKALRRNPAERYQTAEAMLRAWHGVFRALDETPLAPTVTERAAGDGTSTSGHARPDAQSRRSSMPEPALTDDGDQRKPISVPDGVTGSTRLAEIGMTSRLLAAAGKLGAGTVDELLDLSPTDLTRLRGVANQTRRRLLDWRRALEEGRADRTELSIEGHSADALAARLLPGAPPGNDDPGSILDLLLGATPPPGDTQADPHRWVELGHVASILGLSRSTVDAELSGACRRWAKTPAITEVRNHVVDLLTAHGGVMTAGELADAVVALRGSEHLGVERARIGAAVARAATETEATMKSPRWTVRRVGDHVLLASGRDDGAGGSGTGTADEQAAWVAALAAEADRLCAAGTVLSGGALATALRAVLPAAASGLPDSRIVALAAATSTLAAVSSRLELYPRGLPAADALRRAQGALLGPAYLTEDELRRRVRSRFPDAEDLPPRPALDRLLADAGIALTWDGANARYEAPRSTLAGISTATSLLSTRLAARRGTAAHPDTDDTNDADELDRRLARSLADGGFLALTVPVRSFHAARARLARQAHTAIDLDSELVDGLRAAAAQLKIPDFAVVLAADREPATSPAGTNLRRLVDMAVQHVEATVRTAGPAVLLTGLGLLARYGRLGLIEAIRDDAGTAASPLRTVWILLPAEDTGPPVIDGHPLPTLGPGQWATLTTTWLTSRSAA